MGTSSGGMGRHVQGLVKGLVARGHDAMVACPKEADDLFGYADTGARVVHVPISDRPNPAVDMRNHATLRGLIEGSDVVHAHGLRAGAVCALARTGLSNPLVVTLHNATPDGSWLAGVYNALDRLVASKADMVLCVSSDLENRQRELGAKHVASAVIPAPPFEVSARDRSEVRAELGIDDDTKLAVVIARLSTQKGLPVLLNAANLLRDKGIQFVIAGDGPLRDELQDDIDNRSLPVRLLGDRRDVPDLLQAADVVVSSANWEGQPLALQEALAAGCPIVTTDAGGTAAVVGSAGVLVPVGDVQALAAAVDRVLSDPEERADLSRRAKARADALPTIETAVDAALQQYENAIAFKA
ncbi:glycosyltransferase family 4 protein [Arsenicicoccus piscis]|nr:glycosyltransferase family 4 protein [Arsenicicoccus piscis]MCH8627036.1 glycosyltransferase family 4 protein [Arsenicicoccus piscis]